MTAKLPVRANAKLTLLQDGVAEAEALTRSTLQRVAELERKLAAAGEGRNDIANIEHEISRLRAVAAQHQAKADQRLQLVTQINAWLARLPAHYALSEAPCIKTPMRQGESPQAVLTRIRHTISALQDELRLVQHASPTRDEQHDAARAYVANLAESFRPKIKAHRHGKLEVDLSDPGSFTPRANMLGLLARLDGGSMVLNWLQAEIDALPKPALSLSQTDKEERIATIRADLLKHEREEEAAIESAALDGAEIERRPFADPLAILGVALVPHAKAA